MKRLPNDGKTLVGELARVSNMERDELVRYWKKLYGTPPVERLSRKFLMYALAYRLQENEFGGLRPQTKRLLAMAAKEDADTHHNPPSIIPAGTRLIREWHGHSYEVAVLKEGVMLQGKQYRSLTEVARIITGTHQSGYQFFGLKAKRGAIRT